ncbi:MAG: hypothetical protein IPJ66_11370 [Bacteroidetes bacterium]|nr:hypothetical protein [Bacteroidota bacterium]
MRQVHLHIRFSDIDTAILQTNGTVEFNFSVGCSRSSTLLIGKAKQRNVFTVGVLLHPRSHGSYYDFSTACF